MSNRNWVHIAIAIAIVLLVGGAVAVEIIQALR